ncbi:hypothetical protein ERX27_09130 [Macrococcus brunensis]|uniref:Regulatory protein YycH domain-containing protein n=2 Tax=Macrococcus brunensis TaxID=198483 RepID=A0A4R6BBQ2_9STAP|nr:hypothetical protein ERX27_09130 [Macrococcus brunensis]
MMVIGMYKNIIKSLILIILVCTSMVLTYLIWNFKPQLTNVDTAVVEKKTIGPRFIDNIKNIYMPYQVVSYNEGNIKGTTESHLIIEMTNFLSESHIQSAYLIDNNGKFQAENIGNRFTLFDFTVDIPQTMYVTNILDMNYKSEDKYTFKRLMIDSESRTNVNIYLIGKTKVLKIETDAKSQTFNKMLQQERKSMVNYTSLVTNELTSSDKMQLYIPEEADSVKAYRYIADRINVKDINDAVLDDQDNIIERDRKESTTYFSNTGIVSVNDSDIYKYNNLSEADSVKAAPRDILVKSFKFISSHGGFTDDYRLFDINDDNRMIDYQMYLGGRPVFNDTGLSNISVIWGKDDQYEYRRGLLSTSVAVPSTQEVEKLPSAESVRYRLASSKEYRFDKITNMLIGYEMKKSADSEIQANLLFEPYWYIEYDNQWLKYENGRLK